MRYFRIGALAPLDFKILSKKRLFFQLLGVKNKFHHFWPPLENILGKSPTAPLEKILPTPMATSELGVLPTLYFGNLRFFYEIFSKNRCFLSFEWEK